MAFHRSVSICKPRHFIMRRSRSNRRLAFIVPATGSSSLAARCEIAGDDGRTLHFLVFVCCVALRISAESPILFVLTHTHTHTHTHTPFLPGGIGGSFVGHAGADLRHWHRRSGELSRAAMGRGVILPGKPVCRWGRRGICFDFYSSLPFGLCV